MRVTKIILGAMALISIGAAVFFGVRYSAAQEELQRTNAELKTYTTNEKILAFGRLFVEKVLKSGEVSFDDRVKLENAALAIENVEVLAAWKRFVESKTELEAQVGVKDLIASLFTHIAEKK